MISFEEYMSPERILQLATKYYEKQDYVAVANFLQDKYDKCPLEIQSQLLELLGNVYIKWEAIEQAIWAFKYAIKCNPLNSNAYLDLANACKNCGEIDGFKEALVTFSNLDYQGLSKAEELVEYFNSLSQNQLDNELFLVDDDFKSNDMLDKAFELYGKGEFDVACDCLEKLIEMYPDYQPAYELLICIYLTLFDEEKLADVSERRFKRFPDNVEAIAMYLYTKRQLSVFEGKELTEKMLNSPIDNILSLKRICEVLDARGEYDKCVELINNYSKKNENNYDILMMQMIASLKIGNYQNAKQLLKKINNYYGIIGLGRIYGYLFDCNKDALKIVNYNSIPDELWEVANTMLSDVYNKAKTNQPIDDDELWNVFELIVMTADEDIIINFMIDFKDSFTLKCSQKILAINYLREIPSIVRAGILYAMLKCGITQFTFFTAGGLNKEEFLPIEQLKDYPECYSDAYYYAFAYCAFSTEDFAKNIYTSTVELLDAMKESNRKFRDEYALAAAIICNSYVLVNDDIVKTVSRVVECNEKRVKSYIYAIKKNGEFFDLEDDDIFELVLKRIHNKILKSENPGE